MAYSNPRQIFTSFGEEDIADAARALSFKGPAGKKGRLMSVSLSATETFNAVSTSAKLQIGTAADTDAYAEITLGTLAATDSVFYDYSAQSIDLPADTQVEVTEVANTGGTPAGKCFITIGTEWAD
jgi:hypothetical protein